MAKNDFNAFLLALRDLCNEYLGEEAEVESAPAAKPTKKAAAKKPTPAEPDDPRTALGKLTLAALRKQVLALVGEDGESLFTADQVKGADKDILIDTLLEFGDAEEGDAEEEVEEEIEEDAEEEAEEEDGEEEEAEDEEGEGYTAEELEALTLKELKAIATDAGYDASDLKGLTKADLVATILQEDDEDEDGDDGDEEDAEEEETEAEEAEEEDEDAEEEEESDEEWYTADDLKGMSLAELKVLGKEYKVPMAAGITKPALIKKLVALGG